MPLTDEQIISIQNIDAQTAIEIMHECAERLGLVSVDEYAQIMGESKRTIYQAAKDSKKMKFELSGRILLAINDV